MKILEEGKNGIFLELENSTVLHITECQHFESTINIAISEGTDFDVLLIEPQAMNSISITVGYNLSELEEY
jgi:hypothetical protein